MTHQTSLEPHRPTLDDLDPATATTDRTIARVRNHRAGEDYPTADVLLGNLPKVLRALGDHLLSGEATALDVAYRLASTIDAIEHRQGKPEPPRRTHRAVALIPLQCGLIGQSPLWPSVAPPVQRIHCRRRYPSMTAKRLARPINFAVGVCH